MVDRIEMALDDIIRASKKGGRGGGAGRKFDTTNRRGSGGFRNGRSGGGGVMRGRNRGGVTKASNYTRVNPIIT